MHKPKPLKWFGMTIAVLLAGGIVHAADINISALTQEIQRMSQKPDRIAMVWWIPEEFWAVNLTQVPGITTAQTDEVLKVIRPYTMVAAVDGTMGAFGGITYKSEEWIRANTRLVDAQGRSYAPNTVEDVNADTRNMLQMIKPILANMLGPMGQNMHFFLFPAKTEAGTRIASAKEKGQFTVKLGDEEFKWRLPLDALLPVKFCPGCKQECKGSWSFCPWCGESLGRK